MPRRRELKAVAFNLLCSFVSRNNDVEGYWAMGKLYSHALKHNLQRVEIDLLEKNILPFAYVFRPMVWGYSDLFLWLCEAQNMHSAWVQGAHIRITFGASMAGRHLPAGHTRGDLFECLLEVKDDLGRIHSASLPGWCAPHDPEKEHRSARA